MEWIRENKILCKKIGIIVGVYLGMKYLVPLVIPFLLAGVCPFLPSAPGSDGGVPLKAVFPPIPAPPEPLRSDSGGRPFLPRKEADVDSVDKSFPALCAYRLEFIHPKTQKPMVFRTEPENPAFAPFFPFSELPD